MTKFASSIDKKKAPVYPIPRMATLPIMALPKWDEDKPYFSWEGDRDGSDKPEVLAEYLNKWHSRCSYRYKDNSRYSEVISMVVQVSDNISESLYQFTVQTLNLNIEYQRGEWFTMLRIQSQKTSCLDLIRPATDQDHAEQLRTQLIRFVAQYPVMDLDIWTLYAEEVGGVVEWS